MSDTGTRVSSGTGASPLDQVKDVAGDIKERATRVAHDVSDQLGDGALQLLDTAKSAALDATTRLRSAVGDQKSAGADFASGLADAVRQAAGPIEAQIPQAGSYIRKAAAQIDAAAEAVRGREIGELIEDLQGVARRQPAVFLGIAAVVGFAAVRFLRSSSSRHDGRPADLATANENTRRLAGAATHLPGGR